MDDKKMLRAILNGQSALKADLLKEIRKLDKRVSGLDQKLVGLDKKIDGVEARLTERLDMIGKQLAYLEDDTPTLEEFNKLEEKVRLLSKN